MDVKVLTKNDSALFTTFCVFWAHTSWPSELGPQPITTASNPILKHD